MHTGQPSPADGPQKQRAPAIVLTGATAGIGRATALAIAQQAGHLILHGLEEQDKVADLLDAMRTTMHPEARLTYLRADYGDLANVTRLAHQIRATTDRIDLLINNAARPGPPTRTLDDAGHEITLTTNYLAPVLLTTTLIDLLGHRARGRIVNVASATHLTATLYPDDLDLARHRYTPSTAYAHAKLALVTHTCRLATHRPVTRSTSSASTPGWSPPGYCTPCSPSTAPDPNTPRPSSDTSRRDSTTTAPTTTNAPPPRPTRRPATRQCNSDCTTPRCAPCATTSDPNTHQPKAPSMTSNRQIVTDAFAAWAAGTSYITAIFAPHLRWEIVGRSAASTTYDSADQFVAQVLRPFGARFSTQAPFRPVHIRAVHADDDQDTVAVVWDGEGTTITGTTYRNTYAWFMTLKDGQVVQGTAFYDSITFNELWDTVNPAS